MPIQAPQWTDYLNCPVCCREFGAPPRSPISLGCGHTLCRHCLKHLHRKQCPFDQTVIQVEAEELVVNTALLQLAGYTPPAQPYHPPCIQALPESDRQAYDAIVRCMEHLAVFLKYCGNANSTGSSRLSRPMQRKLVTLLQCAMTDEEGRGRATRAARSLGERTVTELILQHQNPQQLSANLWAAVRARGCQFLGPAMQEEVLKLVLLALEDGSALSRKVLVMFVVQRLEPHFPQASKTSIGHVVQLLYRASCFKVSKRECDSSLMQLKEEFRTYESLRREHDAQIVQIATEAGLRIAPDQWSALLYGDTAHKSHMQSIIDKLQTPQSFAQSVQELFIALQRTGDPAQLVLMSGHLDRLAGIDASPDARSPSWQQLAEIMTSLKEVVSGLVHYLQNATGRDSNHNPRPPTQERVAEPSTSQPSPQTGSSTPTHRYKVAMCRDAATRYFCPRGNSCTFAHSEEELERYRSIPNANQQFTNGNMAYLTPMPSPITMLQGGIPMPPPAMYPRYPPPHHHSDNYAPPIAPMPAQGMPPDMRPQSPDYPPPELNQIPQSPDYKPPEMIQMMPQSPDYLPPENIIHMPQSSDYPPPEMLPQSPDYPPPEMIQSPDYPPDNQDGIQPTNYPAPLIHNQAMQNGLMIPVPERTYYSRYGGIVSLDDQGGMQFRPEYQPQVYQGPGGIPYQGQEAIAPMPNIFVTVQNKPQRNISPYSFDDFPNDYRTVQYVPGPRERRADAPWVSPTDVFAFDGMRNSLPHCSSNPDDMFNVTGDRRAVGVDRLGAPDANHADDQELEEELQALERRIDTEFESAD